MAYKKMIKVPLRSKDGKPLPEHETFDYKVFLVYSDRFVILETS